MGTCPFKPGSRIVAYTRDSGGSFQEQSTAEQEQAIQEWAAANGLLLTHIFTDQARPGSSTVGRDGFQAMIHYFRSPDCQEAGLVVWSYTRFSRAIDDSQYFRADLRRRGYVIYSLNDEIPDSPMGRVFESLIDWKNEQFLIDLSIDVRRGQRFVVEQYGASFGRTPTGFKRELIQIDQRRDKSDHILHRLVPDPETAHLVRQAFELRAGGASHKRIYQETGLPVSINLSKMFQNRIYLSELQYGDLIIANYCDPIVDQELWDQVQARRKIDLHPRRAGGSFILSGMAYCSRCGSLLNGRVVRSARQRTTWRYYVCSRNRYPGDCQAPAIPKAVLEKAILLELRDYILTPETLTELQEELRAQYAELAFKARSRKERARRELTRLRKKIGSVIDSLTQMGYSRHLAARLSELEYRESELVVELEKLERLDAPQTVLDLDPVQLAAKVTAALDQAKPDELKEIYGNIIARVDMEREGREIHGVVSFHAPYIFGDLYPKPNNHIHSLNYQYDRRSYELVRT